MNQISPTLRKRIDAVVVELHDIANELQAGSPTLAGIYNAIGQGLDSSHYQMDGERSVTIELPAKCNISLMGKVSEFTDGPATVRITMRE